MAGKQRIVLLVVLLFVAPALLTLGILNSNTRVDCIDGAQSGGEVAGLVTRHDGTPAAEVEVVASKVVGNVMSEELAHARTDANGSFALKLPPLNGRYVLHFSGSLLLDQLVEFGWIGRDGEPRGVKPLAVEMKPGCRLEVEVLGSDKKPVGDGEFELSGAATAGLLSGFTHGRVTRSGAFERGTFAVDGLPPMSVRVQIRMTSGERVESLLDLAEGVNSHRVEL